jgi:hypothetical protein
MKKTLIIALCGASLVLTGAGSGVAQTRFAWEAGWYSDGTNDWYTVRDKDRVLMSTATLRPDSTIAGLVFELDIRDPAAPRSRQYGSTGAWTSFVLTFEGQATFVIDGTPFTRVEQVPVPDFDIRADTPPDRYGLFFLVNQLDQHGESYPGQQP